MPVKQDPGPNPAFVAGAQSSARKSGRTSSPSFHGLRDLVSGLVNYGLFHVARIAGMASKGGCSGVLVVRSDGIGDFVIFADCLQRLVRHFAPEPVDVALPIPVDELAKRCPGLRRVIAWDPSRYRVDPIYRIALARRLARNGCRLAINPQINHNHFGDHVACTLGAREVLGFEPTREDALNVRLASRHYTRWISASASVPEAARGADLLRAIGATVPENGLRPRVFLDGEDWAEADQLLGDRSPVDRWVCLMPGCRSSLKVWPWERFVEVAAMLRRRFRRRMRYIVLGGAEDVPVASELCEAIGGDTTNLAGRTKVRTLAAVIARCDLFIGLDTGAAHMARAVGTAGVVVLGGGHFGRFFPAPGRVRAVYRRIPCYQCNWRCVRRRADCILGISAMDVGSAAIDMCEESRFDPVP